MTAEEFDALVEAVVSHLPSRYRRYLENVAIIVADEPSPGHLRRSGVRSGTLLLGLYEGVPRIAREGRPTSLPDTITLFKNHLEAVAPLPRALAAEIRATIIHEIGHHLGLSEARVRRVAAKHRA